MQYRKLVKGKENISLLGYGCMRYPMKKNQINKELAFSQMKLAYDNGVNYYDTAYIYHGGKSEVILGEFITKYNLRKDIFIADKLPTFLVKKADQIDVFFNTQLTRLATDYIDYYLMHMLTCFEDWQKLKDFKIEKFIEDKKKSGAIKYIGFSFHGRKEEFIKILEDYKWDFCQIQFNYLDEYNQAGLEGLKRAEELEIGVVVMEPLRGGSLANNVPNKVKEIMKKERPKVSSAYLALRFVMNHTGVKTVLSGMNEDIHIKDNINAASITTPNSMTKEEIEVIENIKNVYKELMKVPCTGCNYCMPCPVGVAIPEVFNDYNSINYFGNKTGVVKFQYALKCTGMFGSKTRGANACINCGKCIKRCPQRINIPSKLKEAHHKLDSKFLRFGMTIFKKINKKNKSVK